CALPIFILESADAARDSVTIDIHGSVVAKFDGAVTFLGSADAADVVSSADLGIVGTVLDGAARLSTADAAQIIITVASAAFDRASSVQRQVLDDAAVAQVPYKALVFLTVGHKVADGLAIAVKGAAIRDVTVAYGDPGCRVVYGVIQRKV